MSIQFAAALQEVRRLSILPGYARTKVAEAEFTRAILERVETPEQLTEFITTIRNEVERCPLPAQLGRLYRCHFKDDGARAGCQQCNDLGFYSFTSRIDTLDGSREVEQYAFCSCHPGRHQPIDVDILGER